MGNFRNDVFLERAIVGERLRLAMGLPNRGAGEHAPISDNIEAADRDETYYTPPLINIIKFACNGCAEKRVLVTEGCQGCLAHPCVEVCPKGAITLDRYNGRSHIDPEKCIKCGRCAEVCSYHAIITQERPCAAACGMDAIHTDINGKAEIDYDKCVGCAACTVSCRKKIIVDTYHDLTKLKSTVSFVRCRGGWHNHEVYAKAGATSCREAVKMALDGHCNYGCAGFGDCVKACRFDALEIVQGTAKVNPDKCVGCTACVHVCPQELPVIVPYKGAKMVPCASKDDPEVRKQLCWVGCIGCGDCVDNCPDGLIHLEDGRAVIEPDRCEDCNICSYVCPNGVITAREMPEFTYVQVRAMAAQKGGAAK